MGFKTIKDYDEARYGNMFLLRNDGDFADVILLYRSEDDVLVADTHYIKSADYSGYVHCNGRGCPACAKNIRVQSKLFIPLYNISTKQLEFFDRSIRFENQLHQDVLSKFPNPSEYVFRITRHGVANDINTTYQITAISKNSVMSYDEIMTSLNLKAPDYYSNICKELSNTELNDMINTPTTNNEYGAGEGLTDYQITPRVPAANPEPITEDVAEILNEEPVATVDTAEEADDVSF